MDVYGNKEDAVDRCKWRKVIKEVRWPGWVWAGECFFWYWPTWVVPDKRPLNGCCCCCMLYHTFSRPCTTVYKEHKAKKKLHPLTSRYEIISNMTPFLGDDIWESQVGSCWTIPRHEMCLVRHYCACMFVSTKMEVVEFIDHVEDTKSCVCGISKQENTKLKYLTYSRIAMFHQCLASVCM